MIKLRAHHLLCLPRCYSGGYNEIFAKRQKQVCASLRKNPLQKIKILRGVDDLCAKCPYRKGNNCAKFPDGRWDPLELDEKALKKLKLRKNSVHEAKEMFNLSIKKIPSVKTICKGCNFIDDCNKINKSFMRDLNKK